MLQGSRFPSLHIMCNLYTTATGITMFPFIFALITFGYIMNMNSVVCQDHFDGDVRLVDGKEWEGRIEVYHDGEWRAVCYDTYSSTDREWGDREAWVTCRQLGYPGGKATSGNGYSNTRNNKINDVRCPDDDIDSLRDCAIELQNTDCLDDKQAGVICYNGKTDGACLDGYVPFQTSCYKVSNEQRTRSEAREACESDGGHLADIRSSDENEFIISIIKASGGGTTWFGLLEDSNTPGEYIWSDGSPLIHETWHDIDTDRDDICMRLRRMSGYAWRDDNCDDDNRFVCELQEKPINSTSAGEGEGDGNGVQLQSDNTAAIAGGVAGALVIVMLVLITIMFINRLKKKPAVPVIEHANEPQDLGEHGEVAIYTEYKKTNDSDQAYEALQKKTPGPTTLTDGIENNLAEPKYESIPEATHGENNESSDHDYAYADSVLHPECDNIIDHSYFSPTQTSAQPEATHEGKNESSDYACAYADSVSQPECDDIIDHSYFSPTQTSAQPEATHEGKNESSDYACAYADSVSQPECEDIIDHTYLSPVQTSVQPESDSVPVPQPKCEVNIDSGYLTPMQTSGVQPDASIPEEKHPENNESLEYAYAYADSVSQPIQFGNSKNTAYVNSGVMKNIK
ncbi:uncharacterized protein [Amphiura filiformis]|uniref:uncharacterized protein n=1 Tax=Amphiura filiformis TaxID=82378 RepID=UPI003B22444B